MAKKVQFPRMLRLLLLAAVALLSGILFVLRPGQGQRTLPQAEVPGAAPTSARPEPTAGTESHQVSPQGLSRSDETWNIAGESGRSFYLALDEAVSRDGDGKETYLRLEPPATVGTLGDRLKALAGQGKVLPVAYLEGAPRSPESRRILTAELRVKLAPEVAEQTAGRYGLTVDSIPDYAPGWVVLSASGPMAALDALDRMRKDGHDTADVLLAAQRRRRAMPNDPLIGDQWHLKNNSASRTHVNVESAWNYGGSGGVKGTGIRVAVIDDGLQTAHPDLSPNVDTVNDRDWNGNDADPNPGVGDDHGTSCAGNVAARGNNALGVAGTAPEATLVGLRLTAAATTDAQEAAAMAWKNDLIQIKNNSWGPDDTGTLLEAPGPLTIAAFQTAVATGRGGKGTLFFWAAGNGGDVEDGSNFDGYANRIETLAIGALDSLGARSSYSEPGANVVVCAPSDGNAPALGITTTDRTGANGYNTASSATGGDYANDFGGTSSATPTAAGVAALLLEKNPALGWRDVEEILIRSAYQVKASDPGWMTNGAGIPFHHDFGAGLVDAAEAVTLAASWTNLPVQSSVTSTQSALTVAIPENSAGGITRSFDFGGTNLRVEQVTVRLSVTHTARGNLEIILTSPGGMVSRLAEVRPDTGDHYANWTFSSVRHWGETGSGTWSLKIADRSSNGNSTGGTLTAAEIKLYGSASTTGNPSPVIRIDEPVEGAIFSPGVIIHASAMASDLQEGGAAGSIAQVRWLLDDVEVGTDSTAPYELDLTPPLGVHRLAAEATDNESAISTSASVSFSVVDQPPAIASATLNATGQLYDNLLLQVVAVSAADPEGQAVVLSYQWQSSTDGIAFTDAVGATGATLTAPSPAGKVWRCVIVATAGGQSSTPRITASVNVLAVPPRSGLLGSQVNYAGGLVLRGTQFVGNRQAIFHEFSQGPSGGSSEWIEILTLKAGSLAFWDIQDSAGNLLVFRDISFWRNIPAGTLIVIYNGTAPKDPLLPANDTNAADGRLVLSSTNTAYFDGGYDSWIPLGNSGDALFLNDADGDNVHELSFGNNTVPTPNVGAVGTGKAAAYGSDTENGVDSPANWIIGNATTAGEVVVTPGSPNGSANAAFITSLRSGAVSQPALFRFGTGAQVPIGLSLDPSSGLLSGTISQANPIGDYNLIIQRYNTLGQVVSQSFPFGVAPLPVDFATWIAGFSVGGQTAPDDDVDGDDLSNAMENLLGSHPGIMGPGPVMTSVTSNSATLRHSRSNDPATDAALRYEWSLDLETWFAPGASNGAGVTVEIATSVLEDQSAPLNDLVEVIASITQGSSAKLFVRLIAETTP